MSQELSLQQVAQNEEIICESIHVTGDVQSESLIDAGTMKVEGSTQVDSSQFVKFADIYTHQGNLRCHEAKIVLLDGGEVHASDVYIDTCISGEVYAQNVTVKHLTSSVKICASHSITIEYISGSENQLTINYKDVPILMSKIDLIHDDIKELEGLLQKAKKDNSSNEKDIINEITRLRQELEDIHNSVQTARISITKKCNGINTVSFHVNDSQVISTQISDKQYEPFYLNFEGSTITLHPTN